MGGLIGGVRGTQLGVCGVRGKRMIFHVATASGVAGTSNLKCLLVWAPASSIECIHHLDCPPSNCSKHKWHWTEQLGISVKAAVDTIYVTIPLLQEEKHTSGKTRKRITWYKIFVSVTNNLKFVLIDKNPRVKLVALGRSENGMSLSEPLNNCMTSASHFTSLDVSFLIYKMRGLDLTISGIPFSCNNLWCYEWNMIIYGL